MVTIMTKKIVLICILFASFFLPTCKSTKSLNNLNPKLKILQKAYPNFIIGIDANHIILYDNTTMKFNDFKEKNFKKLLNSADIEDMFFYKYNKGKKFDISTLNNDPGRIRFEPLFKKMYGKNKKEVKKNLVKIIWLPKTVGKELWVTKINNVNIKLQEISNILDDLPHLHKYVDNPAGTFYWRKISGTKRLSTHSLGIAIDINVKYSNYWLWDDKLIYRNQIPFELVKIFEEHGFIWGGKWYHYDTMHFEYRPELLTD